MNSVGSRKEWLAARTSLLAEEKELTRRSDELARKRQALPWVAVEKDYAFEADDGTKTLVDLFDGRSQLLVYHFMFGPTVDGWPDTGCPGCSFTADSLDGAVVHLPPRGDRLSGMLALALVVLGVWVAASPASVPGLTEPTGSPSMQMSP